MQLKTRDEFHLLIDEHKWETGVEVGVGIGLNASYLLDNSKLKTLYGVDNWSVRNPRNNQVSTKDKLSHYGNRFKMLEIDSVEAASLFDDDSLDFVYIDGSHRYRGAKRDLEAWFPKVRKGGFFGGHDYVITRGCGVVRAVDEFFEKLDRTFELTNEVNDGKTNKSFWIIK